MLGFIIIFGFFICSIGSAVALALFQNARDADDAWEETQNTTKK